MSFPFAFESSPLLTGGSYFFSPEEQFENNRDGRLWGDSLMSAAYCVPKVFSPLRHQCSLSVSTDHGNHSLHLLSVYHVADTVLGTGRLFIYLILMISKETATQVPMLRN